MYYTGMHIGPKYICTKRKDNMVGSNYVWNCSVLLFNPWDTCFCEIEEMTAKLLPSYGWQNLIHETVKD